MGMQLRKILILTMLCCLLSLPVSASRWSTIAQDASGTLSFEVSSLKLINNDTTVKVWERYIPFDKKQQGHLYHNEYDLKKKQWRTRSSYVVNSRGRKISGTKKIGPWQPLMAMTDTMTHARYYRDYYRVKGPWTFVKTLPNVGRKWINPETIRKTGTRKYEVWEKTKLNHPTSRAKWLISLTEYDVEKGKALTKYLCVINPQGYMTENNAEKDKWLASEDTYGEYVGAAVEKQYKKMHKD
jgi:hypothetical protein